MMRQLSLKQKILGICAMLSAGILIVGLVNFLALKKISQEAVYLGKITVPNIDLMGTQDGVKNALARYFNGILAFGSDPTEREFMIKGFQRTIERGDLAIKDYEDNPHDQGETELYEAEIKPHWAPLKAELTEIMNQLNHWDPAHNSILFERFKKDIRPLFKKLEAGNEKLRKLQAQNAAERARVAQALANQSAWISVALMLFGTLFGLIVGTAFSQSMARNLGSLIERLSETSGQVAHASSQISDGSTSLSSSTEELAAALQETASAIEEVSVMVTKNADNAQRSKSLSESSEASSGKGQEAVTEMIRSIDEIQASNEEIAKQIEKSNQEISGIVQVIAAIAEKTKVINDIVFQTKLLSFNASVEAARAGEHGKGFAVVAEEVGNLAQMSGTSAKEIGAMLDESTRKVEQIVADTRSRITSLVAAGNQKVQNGTLTAKRCAELLDEIVGNVSQVNQMSTEIATASQEQSKGVQEINQAISQLDQVTQQNSTSAQASAASAQSLTLQAQELRQITDLLVETVQGKKPETQGPGAQILPFEPKARSKMAI